MRHWAVCCVWVGLWAAVGAAAASAAPPDDAPGAGWPQAMLTARTDLAATLTGSPERSERLRAVRDHLAAAWPVEFDWFLQDAGPAWSDWLTGAARLDSDQAWWDRVAAELGDGSAALAAERRLLDVTADAARLACYASACELRRARRLASLRERTPRLVFAKHGPLGGSHYAYTEAQSDAQSERNFTPGGGLCLLDLAAPRPTVRTLLDAGSGVIRDPDVSYDGQRVLFAWKQSDHGDDYHLYELDVASGRLRQLTFGLGMADYEGAYLPDGQIVFNSTRCVQTVDCWWTEVSNLYTCGPRGEALHRLSFDQVHTNYPTVLPDGRVTYTRWDYNDRGQVFPQGLFVMNPDGTGQTAFYGNNSWFPTTIAHARGIPGTRKVMAIATGHHSFQPGQLLVLDPAKGREENAGAQLIAPVRPTPAVRVDALGQQGPLFAYPYPLSEAEFLVTFNPFGWDNESARARNTHFGIYFMTADGRRELLTSDPQVSCNQAVPLQPRPRPAAWPSRLAGSQESASYYVQDVYRGPGLAGVPRGTVTALRVVALDFRAAGIGANGNAGPAGGALSSTPISLSNGAWDVKRVLGTATVHADGSAYFSVPARTPVYFQALNARNEAVQTMRSWSTLQPGERAACVGCHEDKNSVPPPRGPQSLALRAGVEQLVPFYGPSRGFSFPQEIQPILDRRCISCHRDREAAPPYRRREAQLTSSPDQLRWVSPLEAVWHYTLQPPGADWPARPAATQWPTGTACFGTVRFTNVTSRTPWTADDIWLEREFDLPGPFAGQVPLLRVFHDEDIEIWLNGVPAARREGFVVDLLWLEVDTVAAQALHPGRNRLSVHCRNTGGGQGVDVGLGLTPRRATSPAPEQAFSLLAEERLDTRAQRRWSAAYLALTQAEQDPQTGVWRGVSGDPVNWLWVQSAPPLLPPSSGGAVRSRLLRLLDAGHGGVRLTLEERDKLACWIDLLVPFCGDYREANAWSPADVAKYEHFLAKRQRLAALEARNLRQAAAAAPARPEACTLRLQVLNAAGAVLAEQRSQADAGAAVTLAFDREYVAGDRVVVTGSPRLAVRADAAWPEGQVFVPDGRFEFRVPVGRGPGAEGRVYPPTAFAGKHHQVTARPLADDELVAYRNVALNPLDSRGASSTYPHLTTNSECRGEPDFAARNAIDGQVLNRGHGAWPFQSWGPDQRTDLWLKLELGRPVEVDQLVLTMRADFPHDHAWRTAKVEFSDGSREPLVLTTDAGRQTFNFAPRTVTWLRLADLVQPEPLGWCGVTELEAWGAESLDGAGG